LHFKIKMTKTLDEEKKFFSWCPDQFGRTIKFTQNSTLISLKLQLKNKTGNNHQNILFFLS